MYIAISYSARFDLNLRLGTDMYNFNEPQSHKNLPFHNVDERKVRNSAIYNSGRLDLNVRNRDRLADRTLHIFPHVYCPLLWPCTMHSVQIRSTRADFSMFQIIAQEE